VSKPKPPRAAKCKTCGADIYWATDVSTARACPIDVAPVAGANVLLAIDASGAIKSRVLGKGEDAGGAKTRMNHWVTCTAPPERKGKGQHKGGSPA